MYYTKLFFRLQIFLYEFIKSNHIFQLKVGGFGQMRHLLFCLIHFLRIITSLDGIFQTGQVLRKFLQLLFSHGKTFPFFILHTYYIIFFYVYQPKMLANVQSSGTLSSRIRLKWKWRSVCASRSFSIPANSHTLPTYSLRLARSLSLRPLATLPI